MPKVLSLDKSIDVLEAIFAAPNGVGTRALAKALDLNVATVHNIAMTFVARGYLRQDPIAKTFHPGLALMLMGQHNSLRETLTSSAAPLVSNLAARLNESVMLAMIEHMRVVNLLYVSSRQALRVNEPDDVTQIAYCTGFGKLLLASLSERELSDYLSHTPLKQFTPRTITDPIALRAELAHVRETGIARTCDELEDGVSAIAVPIVGQAHAQVIAALGASAPTLRMQEPAQIDETTRELRSTARAIESAWATPEPHVNVY